MVDRSYGGRTPLPPDDLALLSGLQPHEVRDVAESRIQEYLVTIANMNRYITQLRTIQNTTVHLHVTLPPEVLMNVFRHVSPTRRSHIRLTHVCKLWRDLIHRTPEFWADMLSVKAVRLDHDNPNPHLSLLSFIERSSPVLFKLNLTGNLAIFALIPSHMARIQSLSWESHGADSLAQLTTLLDLDLPQLEVLRCTSTGPRLAVSNTVRHLTRGRGEFPRLRRLTLCGGLACPGFAFPSLKELKVEDGESPQSLDLLKELLRSSRQLESLELILRMPFVDDRSSPWRDVVSLPHLRVCSLSLHTSDVEEPGACRFLQHVRLPAAAQLKGTWFEGYEDSLAYLIPAHPETFHAIRALTIRYFALDDDDTDPWVLRASGFVLGSSKARLKLSVHHPCWTSDGDVDPSSTLADFASLFSAEARTGVGIRYVKISLESESGRLSVTQGDWLTILSAFPALYSLTVHIPSCRNLLTVLRRNPGRWPALRKLSISCRNGSGVHECLLSVVESRLCKGLRMKYLVFSGGSAKQLSVHRMRRLQELVRDVVVNGESEPRGAGGSFC